MGRAIQHFSKTLAAGEQVVVNAYARMLTLVEISGGDSVGIGIGRDPIETLKQGISYELPQGQEYSSVSIKNEGSTAVTVEGLLTEGRVFLNSQNAVLDGILDQLKGGPGASYIAQTTVGTSAVKIADENTDRRMIELVAHPSNAGQIYIGKDNTVTSTNWFSVLTAGGSFSLETYTGEVWAIASTAGQLLGGHSE